MLLSLTISVKRAEYDIELEELEGDRVYVQEN